MQLRGIPDGEQNVPVWDFAELLISLRALQIVKKGMTHARFPDPIRPGNTSKDICNINISKSEFPESDSGYSAQAKDNLAPLAVTPPLLDTFQSR